MIHLNSDSVLLCFLLWLEDLIPSHSSATHIKTQLQRQMGTKKRQKKELPSQSFLPKQHQKDRQPRAMEFLWLNKWLFPEWCFKQMSESTCQGIKNNSSLSCNNSKLFHLVCLYGDLQKCSVVKHVFLYSTCLGSQAGVPWIFRPQDFAHFICDIIHLCLDTF